MNYQRDRFAQGLGILLAPHFFRWTGRQIFDPNGAAFTAIFGLAFVVISIGWNFSVNTVYWTPAFGERMAIISQHFTLDMSDVREGRYHVLATHSLMYNDLLHTLVMAVPILFFGTFLEKRLGSCMTILVFMGGVVIGGLCQILVGDAHFLADLGDLLNSTAVVSGSLATPAEQLREWLAWLHAQTSERNSFSGPAGGVASVGTFVVIQQMFQNPKRLMFLMGLFGIWVLIDWFGFFHFEMSVGLTARIAGCLVGGTFAVLFWLGTRSRKLKFRIRNAWNYPQQYSELP